MHSCDSEWLDQHPNLMLDPDVYQVPGRQYPKAGKNLFGMFADSMLPIRWGRLLMRRREAMEGGRGASRRSSLKAIIS